MSENFNESLTDFLSDNIHENDENPIQALKRSSRASTVSSAKSKSSKGSDNLFGITEEDLELEMSRSKPTASSTPILFNDDDAIATDDEDLGFDPKKPKATPGKSNLFDDILTDAKLTVPIPAARRVGNREERRPASISRQSTDTTTENSNTQRPKTSTGRRGSSMSNVINTDPLGLFSNNPPPAAKEQTLLSVNAKKRSATADWLGLHAADSDEERETPPRTQYSSEKRIESPKTPRVSSSAMSKQESKPQRGYDILKLNETLEQQREPIELQTVVEDSHSQSLAARTATVTETGAATATLATPVAGTTVQSMLQLNTINLETRNAFALLQQQEPQLTLAAQMKQQERALYDMQRKQDALLQQQEQQFQALLQQQLQRQQQLEENIKLQQQRINAHIQLMLTQPASALDALPVEQPIQQLSPPTVAHNESQATTQTAMDLIQVETDIRRLELEKLRLEELVANMKAKYEREIEMIESSHKKQLEVLDGHTVALERRLRDEITEITAHYIQKLSTLESEQQKRKENYELELETLRNDNEDEIRRIRKTHSEDLDMLREEHRRMLEAVQRSKLLEFATVQDNNSYLNTLKAASNNLNEATNELQDIRNHLQTKLELAHKQKQQELDARERRIADRERQLQLSEATTEQEKTQLMKLVSTLEQQLNALSKESNEENWQLRMKLSALEAEKAAFEREREYAREQLQRDEKRLAELKERQLAELQRMSLELQEERRQFHVEQIKYETAQKLRTNSSNNLERERCEMETAMKCAQDATRQADNERQRYYALQRELEQRKREYINAENELRTKQEKLNVELKLCSASEQQAQDAATRARLIERNYQEKLQALQLRIREIAQKEAFLAEERKLLAQQRIAVKETQSNNRTRAVDVAADAAAAGGGVNVELKRVRQQLHAVEEAQKRQNASLNLVDRMLDGNIAESMERLHIKTQPGKTTTISWGADDVSKERHAANNNNMDDIWPSVGLDDDAKSFVLNSNFEAFEYGLEGRDITEL